MNTIQVSVVIVSMNNLKELYACLDSIKKYTNVSYEVLLVAFMFTPENLSKLKRDYPWIIVIESNVLRGFSENNNLALRRAKGKYCFVVNDDTFITSPVIDKLVSDIESLPDSVAIVSPNIKYPDGRDQICGRRYYGLFELYMATLHLNRFLMKSKYENGDGLFQTYNISGAAFLIKTEIFNKVGWFDEYYYFCPEDVALSDKLNQTGYKCYVNSENILYHIGGNTATKVQMATIPAVNKGSVHFYSRGRRWAFILMGLHIVLLRIFLACYYRIKMIGGDERYRILYCGSLNVCKTMFTYKNPKEIFTEIYNNHVRNQ